MSELAQKKKTKMILLNRLSIMVRRRRMIMNRFFTLRRNGHSGHDRFPEFDKRAGQRFSKIHFFWRERYT
jgi:hypothetical protein